MLAVSSTIISSTVRHWWVIWLYYKFLLANSDRQATLCIPCSYAGPLAESQVCAASTRLTRPSGACSSGYHRIDSVANDNTREINRSEVFNL